MSAPRISRKMETRSRRARIIPSFDLDSDSEEEPVLDTVLDTHSSKDARTPPLKVARTTATCLLSTPTLPLNLSFDMSISSVDGKKSAEKGAPTGEKVDSSDETSGMADPMQQHDTSSELNQAPLFASHLNHPEFSQPVLFE